MKFLPLIWHSLWRKKARTIFTLLSILAAFTLFGILGAVRTAFSMGVDVTGADRMVVIDKVTFIKPLPLSYKDRLAAVSGVNLVTHLSWFGGVYKDPKNFFGQMAVEPESFLEVYPEYRLSEEQKKAWFADRTGAIAGRQLAQRFGWKVGDRIPIQATIYRRRDGAKSWEFNLDGIYDGAQKGTDTSSFYFHYDYLKEASFINGIVGWYTIRIADPAHAADIAARIDSGFANSPAETKTSTEKAFAQAFANQVGNIGAIVTAILTAVFFTILLGVGNAIAQSVRERTNELAVLKTLGFTHARALGLVLAESCLIAVVGAGLGLLLAVGVVLALAQVSFIQAMLPTFYIPGQTLALGGALAVLLGLATGTPPAVQAMRLRIVDALRKV
jgi:putative ABC transport system permease protein